MTYIIYASIYLLGIYSGALILSYIIKYKISEDTKKVKKDTNLVYSNLINSISDGNSKFIFRINNQIRIDTYLPNIGNVNVYFHINKKDVSIFQNENTLYISNLVDLSLLNKLNFITKTKFSLEINDTIDIFGIIYSRNYFINTFNINPSLFKKFENVEVEKVEKVEEYLDIDSILDKINLVGYNKLSNKEKDFLNKYSDRK